MTFDPLGSTAASSPNPSIGEKPCYRQHGAHVSVLRSERVSGDFHPTLRSRSAGAICRLGWCSGRAGGPCTIPAEQRTAACPLRLPGASVGPRFASAPRPENRRPRPRRLPACRDNRRPSNRPARSAKCVGDRQLSVAKLPIGATSPVARRASCRKAQMRDRAGLQYRSRSGLPRSDLAPQRHSHGSGKRPRSSGPAGSPR